MDATTGSPGRRRFPAGLLGSIALILAIEPTIAHLKMASYGGSQWAYETSRTVADSGDPDCKVLCFGDSLLKQGLAPPVIEAKAGLKAYNFAVAGGQTPGHYWLLREALQSGIKPSAIVVEYFPKLMSKDPDFNIENWPFLANPGDCVELARLSHNANLLADLLVRQLLPSARCRNSIRANIQYALNGTFPTFENEVLSAKRNWEVNRGAEIVPARPGKIENVDLWMNGYFPKFECTKVNRTYIKKLLNLAASRQIPVFWVLPPYQPVLQARCEASGFDAAHEKFVREFQSRYPNLYVIDGRRAGYDPMIYSDLHHLGREGAAIFSEEVARLLRRQHDDPATTPRWLKLADYRAVATAPPLEDMDGSRRVILDIAARSRVAKAR